MASISLTTLSSLVFLGADSFFYEKTGRTYYNVNLFDSVSGNAIKVNTSEDLFKNLVCLPQLSNLQCDFEFDLNYKHLRLIGFVADDGELKK